MHPLLLTSWSRWRRPRGQRRGPARCSLQPFPSTGTALGRAPALRASRGDALRGGHGGPVRRGGDPRGGEGRLAPGRTAYSRHHPHLPPPSCCSSQPACRPRSAASRCHPLQGREQGPPLEAPAAAHGHRCARTSVRSKTPAASGEGARSHKALRWAPAPQLYQGRAEIHPGPWHVSKHSHNKIFFPVFLASPLAHFKDILSQMLHPSHSVSQLPEDMNLSSL